MNVENHQSRDALINANGYNESTSSKLDRQRVLGHALRTHRGRIVLLLTTWFWLLVQHTCRMDSDTDTMAICAFLASRAIRFGASRFKRLQLLRSGIPHP